MGAQQVLRAVAVGLTGVALLAGIAVADDAGGDAANPSGLADEPVIVVDLRAGDATALTTSRKQLQDALAAIQGLEVVRDAALDGALSGAAVDRDATRVDAALAQARTAFGALDCKQASAAADRAIDDLAARQAAGLDDGPALRAAYAYIVLCADQAGDLATEIRAGARLRALGVTAGDDVGISAATWDKLPEIDATGGEIVAVTVEADQPDATVWIDHVQVGAAPATAFLPAGEHVFAAGAGSGHRAGTRVAVAGTKQVVALALVDQRGTWSELAGMVHAWRDHVSPPTNAGLAAIMKAAKVRFAIVLAGTRTAEIWGQGARDPVAKKIDAGLIDQPLELAAIITDKAGQWDGRAPGDVLLTETPEERAALYGRRKPDKAKWYVYASIAGAILVGGAVIYLNDAATDTQRIVIQGP